MLHAEHVDGDATLELELRPETLEEVVEPIRPAGPRPAASSPTTGPTRARATDPGRADPRQVVEPDMFDFHVVGIDAEIVAEPPLGPDGDVAQAHGPVALVEERLRHDPHRVGEVDHPRAGVGPGRHLLRQPEDDGHRAQCLGEAHRRLSSPDPGTRSRPGGSRRRVWRPGRRCAAGPRRSRHPPGRHGVRLSSRRSRPIRAPSRCARKGHRRHRGARRSGRAGRGRRRPSGPPDRTARRRARGCRCSPLRRRPPLSPRSAT